MRGLKITLFILGMLLLGTQTFRHVYVKWIEPTGSALDAYREEVDEDIAASQDLDELLVLYEKAREARKEFEDSHPDFTPEQRYSQKTRVIFEKEQKLEHAIRQLEAQSKSLFDLHFYWICGLLSVVLGLLAYCRINRWLGMAGMITGFTEMAFWTSPLWRSGGPQGEFDKLLTTKLVLSLTTLALLIGIWLQSNRDVQGTGEPDSSESV